MSCRRALVAMLLALAGTSHAGCPYDPDSLEIDPPTVRTTLSTVTINGRTYDVRGEDKRLRFRNMLQSCEAPEAAEWFRMWRACRRAVNIEAILMGSGVTVTGVTVPFTLLALPFSAGLAGARRNRMVESIRGEVTVPPAWRKAPTASRSDARRVADQLYASLDRPMSLGAQRTADLNAVQGYLASGHRAHAVEVICENAADFIDPQFTTVAAWVELAMAMYDRSAECVDGDGAACQELAASHAELADFSDHREATLWYSERGCALGVDASCALFDELSGR